MATDKRIDSISATRNASAGVPVEAEATEAIDTYMDDDALEFYNRSDSRLRSGKVFGNQPTEHPQCGHRCEAQEASADCTETCRCYDSATAIRYSATHSCGWTVTPPLTSSPPPSEHTNPPTFTAEQSQTHVDARPVRTGRRTSRAVWMGRT